VSAAPTDATGPAALALAGVGVRHADRWALRDLDWVVAPGERWVVLGPNGSGKTTLVRLAAGLAHPTTGTVDVLGARVGRTDLRTLRTRVALASASLSASLRPTLTAHEAVVTARHAALETWWHAYDAADHARADALLARLGAGHLAGRAIGTLSEGERQRVLLARTLFPDPGLVVLDEPTAGLDLAGREELVGRLARLAADPGTPPIVFVTHHVDEIPPAFTHVLMLRDGRVHACGPLDRVLTARTLSSCFGVDLQLRRHGARWTAWADDLVDDLVPDAVPEAVPGLVPDGLGGGAGAPPAAIRHPVRDEHVSDGRSPASEPGA
jgi:iron complex transport system ATP-binding protein